MSNLQIKGLPDSLHAELRRRAGQQGTSVRDYVLELIRRDQAMPSRVDWLAEVRRLEPLPTGGSAAQLVAAARASRSVDAGDR